MVPHLLNIWLNFVVFDKKPPKQNQNHDFDNHPKVQMFEQLRITLNQAFCLGVISADFVVQGHDLNQPIHSVQLKRLPRAWSKATTAFAVA
jgi:hypothetical protein